MVHHRRLPGRRAPSPPPFPRPAGWDADHPRGAAGRARALGAADGGAAAAGCSCANMLRLGSGPRHGRAKHYGPLCACFSRRFYNGQFGLWDEVPKHRSPAPRDSPGRPCPAQPSKRSRPGADEAVEPATSSRTCPWRRSTTCHPDRDGQGAGVPPAQVIAVRVPFLGELVEPDMAAGRTSSV